MTASYHSPPHKRPRLGEGGRNKLFGLALLTPAALFFLVLIVYPLGYTAFLSLHRVHTLSLQKQFVGLQNYLQILGGSEFWQSFVTTLIWTGGALLAQVILGVSVALLLHQKLAFRSLARGLVLFPYIVPTVVAVLVWQWLLNDLYGYVDYLLVDWGIIDRPIAWLSTMPAAMFSLIIVGTWKLFPFVVISVLARLQTIPEQLYEAARVDGASPWARFWDITLPQIRNVLAVVIVLRAIWDFKDFDLPFLLTGGGPQVSTQTLPLLVFKQAFPLLSMGTAAAVAILMMIAMLLLLSVYFMIQAREGNR